MADLPTRGWDQSWSYLTPADAKAAGLGVCAGYLSHTPSKNLTPDDVRAYHAAGIGVVLNWESQAGAPLQGASLGAQDGSDARSQALDLIKAVGYAPQNRPAIYFSCDTNVSAGQYPQVDAYYAAAKAQISRPSLSGNYLGRRFALGAYGQAALVEHLHDAGLTDAEWQTLAWSFGAVYEGAEFYQTAINAKLNGADVDFDSIRHPVMLRAWWPPNHPLNTAIKPPVDWTKVRELRRQLASHRKVIAQHRKDIAQHRKDIARLRHQIAGLKARKRAL